MNANQAKLKSGNFHMVAWIPWFATTQHRIKLGEDKRWWEIEQDYWPILDKNIQKFEMEIRDETTTGGSRTFSTIDSA